MDDQRLDEICERVERCAAGPWRWVNVTKHGDDQEGEGLKLLRAERLDSYGEEVDRGAGVPTSDDFLSLLWADTFTGDFGEQVGEICFFPAEADPRARSIYCSIK